MRLSNFFSNSTEKSGNTRLRKSCVTLHNVNYSPSFTSCERHISLRDVAADSIREEAKSAIHAIACLHRQSKFQGASKMFYSIPEVANDYLKVSRSTVYRLIEAGELELVHIRTCARITAESLASYCARRRNGGN